MPRCLLKRYWWRCWFSQGQTYFRPVLHKLVLSRPLLENSSNFLLARCSYLNRIFELSLSSHTTNSPIFPDALLCVQGCWWSYRTGFVVGCSGLTVCLLIDVRRMVRSIRFLGIFQASLRLRLLFLVGWGRGLAGSKHHLFLWLLMIPLDSSQQVRTAALRYNTRTMLYSYRQAQGHSDARWYCR